jgi:3-oxoacyl-(acyl-carrier-protein) synthase
MSRILVIAPAHSRERDKSQELRKYAVSELAGSSTALQFLEIACDTILPSKARVMIAGGFDDISEEGSYEFANMKATSNAETEFAMGREPTEMSRPATTTRAGVRV